MKKLILLASVLLLAGCASATINTKSQDGKQVECNASMTAMFMSTESVNASACGGKGGAQTAKVNSELLGELIKLFVAVP